MIRHAVRIAVVCALLGGAGLALAFSNGPPASTTGARAIGDVFTENVCTNCHSTFPINDAGGLLEIDAQPFYTYGEEVSITVRLSYAHMPLPPSPKWGFQLTAARSDSGTGVGTFSVPNAEMQIIAGTSSWATRTYVEHTSTGTRTGDAGPVEWTFTWKAPDYPAPKVYLFAAGNAANGGGTSSGDHIFTAIDSIELAPPTGVPGGRIAGLELRAPRPNPFRFGTEIGYSIPTPGQVDLAIFDAQGRKVRTLVDGSLPAGTGLARWDGRRSDGTPASGGLYFARLMAPGSRAPVVQKLTLAR